MKALYNTNIGDLGPGDLVLVRCQLCGHDAHLTLAALRDPPARLGVMNLAPYLRCRNCDERGRVDIRVKWAEG